MAGEAKTTRWGIVESWTKIGLDSDKRRSRIGVWRICFSRSESKKQNLSTEQRGKSKAKITIHRIFLRFNHGCSRFLHFHFSSSALVLPLFEICVFQRNFERKIGDRYSRRFSSDETSTRISNFFFFFSTRKDGKEEREYWTGSSRDRQLDLESEIIFRWNAPHLVIAAQTRGRKFNKEQEEVGRVCVASEPVSFFSSSTQTKLFYLTSPSFCVSWLLPDRTVFSTVNARRARSRPPYSFTV